MLLLPMAGVYLLVCLADPQSATPPKPPPKAATTAAKTSVGASGQRVHIDPVTKKIKDPEPEDLKALSDAEAATAAPPVALTPVVYPNGMIGIDLQGQMLDSVVVTKSANGKLVFDCVKGDGSKAVKAGAVERSDKREAIDEK